MVMNLDLNSPLEITADKFGLDYKKDEVNSYMIKKILKKKYESLGYKTIEGGDFETNLLLIFVRKTKYLDKYVKVKLGEYKNNSKAEEYNQELLDTFDFETVEKLLFICRICSYIGDPGFPDFIVYSNQETALRYVYVGDEILKEKLVFILLSKIFGIEIKLAAVDFKDQEYPESLKIDVLGVLEKSLQSLEKRVNLEKSAEDTGIDLKIFRSWLKSKQINSEEFIKLYNQFTQEANSPTKLKDLVTKLESIDTIKLKGERPEKLKTLRESLGINMLEAVDLLNLWEILHH